MRSKKKLHGNIQQLKGKKVCGWCGKVKGQDDGKWMSSSKPKGHWVCNSCFLGEEFDKRLQAGRVKVEQTGPNSFVTI